MRLPHPCNLLLQFALQTVAFHFITSKVSRKHTPESMNTTCKPFLPLILNSACELKHKVRGLLVNLTSEESPVSPNHSGKNILSFMIWNIECLPVLHQLLHLVGPEIRGKAEGCCKPEGCKHYCKNESLLTEDIFFEFFLINWVFYSYILTLSSKGTLH